jgi:hypothetical protein
MSSSLADRVAHCVGPASSVWRHGGARRWPRRDGVPARHCGRGSAQGNEGTTASTKMETSCTISYQRWPAASGGGRAASATWCGALPVVGCEEERVSWVRDTVGAPRSAKKWTNGSPTAMNRRRLHYSPLVGKSRNAVSSTG